jgi:hypothetical protein
MSASTRNEQDAEPIGLGEIFFPIKSFACLRVEVEYSVGIC